MTFTFPDSFLWGASISSYQCEGGNYNCDWYLWEKEKKLTPAGRACGHYGMFREDFALARQFNLNSMRFSLEWARINPSIGVISQEELRHYREVTSSLAAAGLKPVVTLHHFTNPLWFSKGDGWLGRQSVDKFLAYLDAAVGALKDSVDTWIIFNEPMVYVYNGYVRGIWPPGIKSLPKAAKVLDNIIAAHTAGYRHIKRICKYSQVSVAQHLRYFCPCPEGIPAINSFLSRGADKIFNFYLLDLLAKKGCLDFIGANYYCKAYMKSRRFMVEECALAHHSERRNKMGWNIYPEGFYEILASLKKYKLPVIITENGTSEENDKFYEEYLLSHLAALAKAMREGVDVRGYLWWSLMDNFEWDEGFSQRFGLLGVDFPDLSRKIKPFALKYAKICAENKLILPD